MSERRKRCFEAFQKTGLDGLLFASGPSFQYLAECTSYFWQRNCGNSHARIAGAHIMPEAMIYMNKEGKTTILTIPSLKDHFDIVKNEVVVSYMDQFEDELSHIVDGKKIGIGRDCDEWIVNTLKQVDEKIETCSAELCLMTCAASRTTMRLPRCASWQDLPMRPSCMWSNT